MNFFLKFESLRKIIIDRLLTVLLKFLQGKFIRIHFGPTGKIAGADIETCKYT